MTTECWCALCTHCHIVWPVWSRTDPRFLDHGKGDVVLHALHGNMEHLALAASLAASAMEALNKERRARRIPCPGDGQLAPAPVVLNGSPECNTMVDEAMAWHDARRG
jgi:hypothetical protein